jgi:ABC-type iron transport system FetAB permease component
MCRTNFFDSLEFERRWLRRLILSFFRVIIIEIVLKWVFAVNYNIIVFFTISTFYLKSIYVVIELIITIFFVAFFIIIFVTIVISIIILNCILWCIKINTIDSMIKLNLMLFNVFIRNRFFSLLDMLRNEFDFFRQARDFFQFDFKHNFIDSTNDRDF